MAPIVGNYIYYIAMGEFIEYIWVCILSAKVHSKTSHRKMFLGERNNKEWDEKGEFNLLVKQMMERDPDYFMSCFRMSPEKFYITC